MLLSIATSSSVWGGERTWVWWLFIFRLLFGSSWWPVSAGLPGLLPRVVLFSAWSELSRGLV